MVRTTEAEMLTDLADSDLARLATSVGIDIAKWIQYASSPLPETCRLTLNREDRILTKTRLTNAGAISKPWMTKTAEMFQMPWSRGWVEDDNHRLMMQDLHDTGRITRQEAVSMLPVELLNPLEGEKILDLCSAPGSKATQIAEVVGNSGLVVANEPSNGRMNMLATNRGRLSLGNMVLVQHDGRHLPRIPEPGFDAVLADVPCTGNATSRKNIKVWRDWTPRQSRSLHELQLAIARRGAMLLKPGGRMVYSTCSIDPVENEAVVARLVEDCPWMEIHRVDTDEIFPKLKIRQGLTNWDALDEGYSEYHLPTNQDCGLENSIRINHDDNDTGGFYMALLVHTGDGDVAQGLVREEHRSNSPLRTPPLPGKHTPIPMSQQSIEQLSNMWKINSDEWSWWGRGRRGNIASNAAKDWLWDSPRYTKKGGVLPGEHWHPLKVIHCGLAAFTSSKGRWRVRQEGLPLLANKIGARSHQVEVPIALSLLREGMIELDNVENASAGGAILEFNIGEVRHRIPVWIGAKITPMFSEAEARILIQRLESIG